MDHGQVVDVPVKGLGVGGSLRSSGMDPEHVEALATVLDEVPPIIVHRSTMQVIDGVHRLNAAKLRDRETIPVRFFDGDEDEAFVLAVRSNVAHGLPLSLADRRHAAERIIRMRPQWSINRVARAVGLSSGTVSGIRKRMLGEPGRSEVRIGRDGKLRRINGSEGSRIAAELIAKHPDMTLRQIARAAGVSPETVRSLRNRLRQGEISAEARAGKGARSVQALHSSGHIDVVVTAGAGQDSAAAVERLASDPALRFSATGRELLRLLHIHVIKAEDWERLIDSVPSESRTPVAELAQVCAQSWAEFAQHLESGVANTA